MSKQPEHTLDENCWCHPERLEKGDDIYWLHKDEKGETAKDVVLKMDKTKSIN